MSPRHLAPCALLAALVVAPACSRRQAGGTGGGSAAAPRESIAPLVYPLGGPRKDATSVADFHWAAEAGATVSLDETFVIEVGMGSGLDGLAVTTVPASGHARHVYQVRERGSVRWAQVAFDVERTEIERLVNVLNGQSFLQLPQRTVARSMEDGAEWVVHVRTGGLDKIVYASNAFPDPLVAVARFVSEQIVDKRPELRDRSKPAPLGALYGDHLVRAARRYAVKPVDEALPDFGDAPRVIVLVVPDDPLPEGTRLKASIVDLTDPGRVLADSGAPVARFSVFYNEAKVDPHHHYAVSISLLSGTRVISASAPVPVLTFDGAHAVEVSLAASGGGPATP